MPITPLAITSPAITPARRGWWSTCLLLALASMAIVAALLITDTTPVDVATAMVRALVDLGRAAQAPVAA